ncbi:DNA mismatch endonuclease Vsr [Rhizobiaceae bacterium]|nr:DNA mismatch endonuclease Vsr [Rhizobiaceae bacterium]
MADRISAEARSKLMGRIRDKDTKPEMIVRRLLHRLGFRIKLHRKDLSGRPDIVLLRHHKAIFVHGCFWHRHDCPRGSMPSSNIEFWEAKFARNAERDVTARQTLDVLGWKVLIVWECQTKDMVELERRLGDFSNRPSDPTRLR